MKTILLGNERCSNSILTKNLSWNLMYISIHSIHIRTDMNSFKTLRYELAHSPFSHLLVRSSRACIYIMYSFPPPFILPFKFMFYNILINQPFTKLFQKYGEKVIDIFGLNRNMPYFCIRFPRDGKL